MGNKISYIKNILNKQTGFTLIEILLVLVLALLVFAPAYNAFQVANKTWTYTEASNPKFTEADTVLTYLAQDIRQASRPSDSNNVKAVTIKNNNKGQVLTMYKHNTITDKWEKIFYKVSKDTLSRALISKSNPDDIIAIKQPGSNSPDWQVVLTGLTDTSVFKESGRAIDIKLLISDSSENPRFKPITVSSSFLVRSREAGAIHDNIEHEETNPSDTKVALLTIEPQIIKHNPSFFNRNKYIDYTLKATIFPDYATIKTVTWSFDNSSNVDVKIVTQGDTTQAKVSIRGQLGDNDSITIIANASDKSAECIVTKK